MQQRNVLFTVGFEYSFVRLFASWPLPCVWESVGRRWLRTFRSGSERDITRGQRACFVLKWAALGSYIHSSAKTRQTGRGYEILMHIWGISQI